MTRIVLLSQVYWALVNSYREQQGFEYTNFHTATWLGKFPTAEPTTSEFFGLIAAACPPDCTRIPVFSLSRDPFGRPTIQFPEFIGVVPPIEVPDWQNPWAESANQGPSIGAMSPNAVVTDYWHQIGEIQRKEQQGLLPRTALEICSQYDPGVVDRVFVEGYCGGEVQTRMNGRNARLLQQRAMSRGRR